jgi:hypothetical protein
MPPRPIRQRKETEKFSEYKKTFNPKKNTDLELLPDGKVKLKSYRKTATKTVTTTNNKTLTIEEEPIVAPRQGTDVDDELPQNVYDFDKLFVVNSKLADEIHELMFSFKDDLPASFQDKTPLLDIKPEWKQKAKRKITEPLTLTALMNGDYHTQGSNSDKENGKRIKTLTNKLPSFKEYQNEDNIEWIFEKHLLLFKELFEFHKKNGSSIATIRTYLNTIIRCFTIVFGRAYPLQHKYSLLNMVLKQHLDANESKNRLNKVEETRFIHWPDVLKKRQELQVIFDEAFKKKPRSREAYDANQNLLTVALYTDIYPLRREIFTLKFETDEMLLEGNHVLMKSDGWVLDLNEVKKKHARIDIPIHRYMNFDMTFSDRINPLEKLLKQSYEYYPREYVFTHLNKYPDVSKKASETTMSTRMSNIFADNGVSVGPSTLRSSFVSWRFHQGFVTLEEQRFISRYMRSSVDMLWGSYAKTGTQVVKAIDVNTALKAASVATPKVASVAIPVNNQRSQLQAATKSAFDEYKKKEAEKKLNATKNSALKEKKYLQTYYEENREKLRSKQKEYYNTKVDKYERNRNLAIGKLRAGLKVQENTIIKYNIKPSDYA